MLGMACNEDAMEYLRTPAATLQVHRGCWQSTLRGGELRGQECVGQQCADGCGFYFIFGVHVVERSTVYKGFHCAKERTSFSLSHVITNTDAATLNAQAAFLSLNVSTLLMSF